MTKDNRKQDKLKSKTKNDKRQRLLKKDNKITKESRKNIIQELSKIKHQNEGKIKVPDEKVQSRKNMINKDSQNMERQKEIVEKKLFLMVNDDSSESSSQTDHITNSEHEVHHHSIQDDTLIDNHLLIDNQNKDYIHNNTENGSQNNDSINFEDSNQKYISQKYLNDFYEKKRIEISRSNQNLEMKNKLPITPYEYEIVDKLRISDFLIIKGNTGCGKSTQVPQILLENGYNFIKTLNSPLKYQRIGVTQPRRLAAVTLAQRVQEELINKTQVESEAKEEYLSKLIEERVYASQHVRQESETNCILSHFKDARVSSPSSIKFMTDGLLMRELLADPLLPEQSVIILDECHERSVNTDILLGLLSVVTRIRRKHQFPLKVIMMSATVDLDQLLENARIFPEMKPEVVEIAQKMQEVDIHFNPRSIEMSEVYDESMRHVIQIHQNNPPGGILVFLSGKKEVTHLTTQLKSKLKNVHNKDLNAMKCKVISLYSNQARQLHSQAFETIEANTRLIIIATNIAETSLTIPGVRQVVDGGIMKVKEQNPRSGQFYFRTIWISHANAAQRAGRVGRVAKGHCYRVYSLKQFSNFDEYIKPPILNTPLAHQLLQLMYIGFDKVEMFPFIDAVPYQSILQELKKLLFIGALQLRNPTYSCEHQQLNQNKLDQTQCKLSQLGLKMINLPFDCEFSKCLILLEQLKDNKILYLNAICITILISLEDVFIQYNDFNQDKYKSLFRETALEIGEDLSDLFVKQHLFKQYFLVDSDAQKVVLKNNFLNQKRITDFRKTLKQILKILNIPMDLLNDEMSDNGDSNLFDQLCKNIFRYELIKKEKRLILFNLIYSFKSKIAQRKDEDTQLTQTGIACKLSKNSQIQRKQIKKSELPTYVFYLDLINDVKQNRNYLITLTQCDLNEQIDECDPLVKLVKSDYSDYQVDEENNTVKIKCHYNYTDQDWELDSFQVNITNTHQYYYQIIAYHYLKNHTKYHNIHLTQFVNMRQTSRILNTIKKLNLSSIQEIKAIVLNDSI